MRARSFLIALASLATAAWLAPGASAAVAGPQAQAARTVPLAIPLPGDLLVARLDLRTDAGGAALPKLRLLGRFPEGVTAATAVGRAAKPGRAVGFIVLANAAGSDAAGMVGVTLGSGGRQWRILASVPRAAVHLLFEADGTAASGVATADSRFCRGPAGGSLVRFGAAAACSGQAAVPEGLVELLGGGSAATPSAPHPAECFGTWFPSGPALHFEFRLACATRAEGYTVFSVGAEMTTAPEGCSETFLAGPGSSYSCFPNPPIPPGTTIGGPFETTGEPTKVGAGTNPDNRTVLVFDLVRQPPSGCTGATVRLSPTRLRATLTCPPGASLFGFQAGLAGGAAAPRIDSFATTTRGCGLATALGSPVFSAVRCSGYYPPRGTAGFSATLFLGLADPAGAAVETTFTAQPTGGAWELLPT